MGCCFRVFIFLFFILGGMVCELGHFQSVSHEAHFPDLFGKGKALRAEGRFEEAIGVIYKALETARNQGLISHERDCFLELGILFWNVGRSQDAEYCFREAICDFNQAEDYLAVMSLYSDGVRFQENKEYSNAAEAFRKGIKLSRKAQSAEFEVTLQRQRGDVYHTLDDIDNYFICNEKAMRLARSIRHRIEEGKSLKNIAIYHLKTSRHEKALISFEKALKIFVEREEHDEAIECLKSIGNLYAEWGDFDKSFSYLCQALAQGSRQMKPAVFAEHLLNIGLTYRKKWIHYRNIHDLFQALAYSRRALEIEGLQNHESIVLSVLTAIGGIYSDIGQYEEALECFRKVEEKTAAQGLPEERVHLMNKTGQAMMGMGLVNEAMSYYKRALGIAEARGMDQMIWESYTGLAECYQKKENPEQSLKYYARAIEKIEKVRRQIAMDIFKAGFSRDKMKAYHGVIDLLFEELTRNPSDDLRSDLFLSVEKVKARAFLESLAGERQDLSVRMRQKEMDISLKISSIVHSLYSSAPSSSVSGDLKDRLLRAEEEYMRWVSKARASSLTAMSSHYQDSVSLSRIQSELLNDRTALVEYFLGDQRSLVFIVTRWSCRVFPLPPRQTIEKQLKGYMKLIAQLPGEPFSNHRASERIAEELLFPFIMDEELKNIDTLIIVPDGILHFLPFESLRTTKSDSPAFLVERFRVSYASSASALVVLGQNGYPSEHRKMLLAFGNPNYGNWLRLKKKGTISRENFKSLPYSRKEIGAISKVFPRRQIDVFQREKANKTLLKSLDLMDYRILHFACHGHVDEKFPIRSALILSPMGRDDDGILQIREIYAMRMNAELVVLSACQSGRGRIEHSEGIMGLPRIFFSAGARSVISSLWPIRDDATAIFMRYFYECLSDGKSKNQALRSAKLKMLKTRFSHPHYWAAFVLHGDYSSSIGNLTH